MSTGFSIWQWLSVVAVALTAAFLVRLSVTYAQRLGLIDEPGNRRSHVIPTPRGGGIGIVIAIFLAVCIAFFMHQWHVTPLFILGSGIGILSVATIGWWDDHRPLSAINRILVHFAVGVLLFFSLRTHWPENSFSAVLCFLIVVSVMWSINLHNFMDGINGLLSLQTIFVFLAFALLAIEKGAWSFAWINLCIIAAVVGFLPFNFPRARIFMGDVGSGTLGYLVAVMAWLGIAEHLVSLPEALLISSAFVTDTGCTLFSRMVRGRRWYKAHREHLYQWLVRVRHSHGQVVSMYMLWNLALVMPLLLWMQRLSKSLSWLMVMCVYVFAAIVWYFSKQQCLIFLRKAHATT